MKTSTVLLIALGICCMRTAVAQDPVALSFSNPSQQESAFVQASADLQGICALRTLVTGKIAGRRCRLDLVRVVDGEELLRMPMDEAVCASDTLEFFLAARTVGTDSVRIAFRSPVTRLCALGVGGSDRCMLMETYPERTPTTDDAIPVAAFCQGEPIEVPLPDGSVFRGLHYCSVRDGHLHPSKWHDRFRLKDYLYFEIKFTNPTER